MFDKIKGFIYDEEGLGTVEILIILAVLVGIALVFRNEILGFAETLFEQVEYEEKDAEEKLDNGMDVNGE